MKNFEFTLVLAGKRQLSDDLEDAIFEAGCDDATLSLRNAIAYLDFDREANSFKEAVISAIQQLENSKMSLTVERVESNDLAKMAEITVPSVRLENMFVY
jgi:hypothetical protein